MFTFYPKSICPRNVNLPPEWQQSERQKEYQVDTFNTGGGRWDGKNKAGSSDSEQSTDEIGWGLAE